MKPKRPRLHAGRSLDINIPRSRLLYQLGLLRERLYVDARPAQAVEVFCYGVSPWVPDADINAKARGLSLEDPGKDGIFKIMRVGDQRFAQSINGRMGRSRPTVDAHSGVRCLVKAPLTRQRKKSLAD